MRPRRFSPRKMPSSPRPWARSGRFNEAAAFFAAEACAAMDRRARSPCFNEAAAFFAAEEAAARLPTDLVGRFNEAAAFFAAEAADEEMAERRLRPLQ